MAHFFDLPAELRNRIYSLVFNGIKVKFKPYLLAKRSVQPKIATLLFVSETINAECRPIFFELAHINISYLVDVETHDLLPAIDATLLRDCSVDVAAITSLRPVPLANFLKAVPNLKSLTFYGLYVLQLFLGEGAINGHDHDSDEECWSECECDACSDNPVYTTLSEVGIQTIQSRLAHEVLYGDVEDFDSEYGSHGVREMSCLVAAWNRIGQPCRLKASFSVHVYEDIGPHYPHSVCPTLFSYQKF